jgi:S-adenosylmethionine:tRNA ribosyltransferase-isomerase
MNSPSDLTDVLKLETYDYPLPENLIAQQPLEQRDHSRLIVRRRGGEIFDSEFLCVQEFIPENALLVVNASKVFPCRITGQTSTGGKFEVFLIANQQNDDRSSIWLALGKPRQKIKKLGRLKLDSRVELEYLDDIDEMSFRVRLNASHSDVLHWLEHNGQVPLPPYIHRPNEIKADVSSDYARYQTIYAEETGSAAAPTAGLHFTPRVLQSLAERNIRTIPIVLHVGTGTFLPVKSQLIEEHQMHRETYKIPETTLQQLSQARSEQRPIIAVGTTSLRCLESFAMLSASEQIGDQWKTTNLFIRPRADGSLYRPHCGVSGLITNFHQPKSTLFILICALIGVDEANRLYRHAVAEGYRFLSYGDSCYFEI